MTHSQKPSKEANHVAWRTDLLCSRLDGYSYLLAGAAHFPHHLAKSSSCRLCALCKVQLCCLKYRLRLLSRSWAQVFQCCCCSCVSSGRATDVRGQIAPSPFNLWGAGVLSSGISHKKQQLCLRHSSAIQLTSISWQMLCNISLQITSHMPRQK